MPCADGDSRSACSAVSTETMPLLVAESQGKSCPVPLLCGWRNLPKGASGPFPPELLQKLLCWISTELTEGDLGNLISCTASARVLQTLAVFLAGFLSEAKNRKLSKEVSAGTHRDLWGTQSVGTIIRFVYLLLAKLSISCQHLKSCHSGHIQHWQRKLGTGVEERHWKMNPEVCTVTHDVKLSHTGVGTEIIHQLWVFPEGAEVAALGTLPPTMPHGNRWQAGS